MKLRYRLLTFLMILGLFGAGTNTANAQLGDVGQILQSSTEDAERLVQAYLKPFGSGFGAGLNSGWTNTAQPHKTLGFDLTVSSGLAVVPDADKAFDIADLNLQELEVESGPPTLQTINGKSDVTTTTLAAYETINGQREQLFEFDMPTGTGFGYVPAPELKAGVGIIKDTELMLRYVPEVDISDYGTFSQYGFGAKHGLNQWLPGGKLLPVNLSVMVGYTNQTVSSGFRLTGEEIIDESKTENPYENQPSTWDGQKIKIDTEAYTINALVGKSLPVIAIYGGVGYEVSSMKIGTPGTYPTVRQKKTNDQGQYQEGQNNSKPLIVDTINKPIGLEFDGKNGVHALAGFRLRFTIFHISASYKLANYSTFNAGFGISFR